MSSKISDDYVVYRSRLDSTILCGIVIENEILWWYAVLTLSSSSIQLIQNTQRTRISNPDNISLLRITSVGAHTKYMSHICCRMDWNGKQFLHTFYRYRRQQMTTRDDIEFQSAVPDETPTSIDKTQTTHRVRRRDIKVIRINRIPCGKRNCNSLISVYQHLEKGKMWKTIFSSILSSDIFQSKCVYTCAKN